MLRLYIVAAAIHCSFSWRICHWRPLYLPSAAVGAGAAGAADGAAMGWAAGADSCIWLSHTSARSHSESYRPSDCVTRRRARVLHIITHSNTQRATQWVGKWSPAHKHRHLEGGGCEWRWDYYLHTKNHIPDCFIHHRPAATTKHWQSGGGWNKGSYKPARGGRVGRGEGGGIPGGEVRHPEESECIWMGRLWEALTRDLHLYG